MKKICNFRLTLTIALTFIVAIALATYVFVSQESKLIMLFISLGVFLIFIILSIIFKKRFLVLFTALSLFVAFPFLSNYLKGESLNKNIVWNNQAVYVTGRLSENYKFTTSGNLQLVLDDVVINGEHKISGDKIVIYSKPDGFDLTKITLGRYLSVKTTLEFFTLQDDDLSYSLYCVNRNIVASGFAMFYNVDVDDEVKLSLKDKIKQSVYNNLNRNDIEHASIGYAMLFGDTSLLDTGVKADFQSTGIAHLLAVSGLHVSIIVLIINFILNKLKLNFRLNISFLIVILTIYCYLCDFSVSVIRASLMALFALYAKARGKCYDNLSVLSFVAVIILLINPLEMFNISFILSFFAVLSIMLLLIPIDRFFSKYFYGRLSSSLSLNLAVQIGLFATNVFYFGRYPLLGILANFVAVPIATIAFVFLVLGVILSSILPFMGFVNHVFGFLMNLVVKFNGWISNMGIYLRFGSISFAVVLLMFLAIYVLSDFVFMKKSHKRIVATGTFASALLMMLL